MSKPIAFQYKQNGSINLFVNSSIVTIGVNDINYAVVLTALQNGDWDAVTRNLTVKTAIADHTNGRVEIFGDEIHVDKKPLPVAVAKRILPLFKMNGFNLNPIFRLLENIEANPAEFSRNELFLFLESNDLPITPDGHFLAYKMVRSDYMDIYSGTIRNMVGDTPSMDRSKVETDRNLTCSRGLHFCAHSYLDQAYGRSSGYHLMVVKINPADVVSIPSDYNNSKGRCWTYTVVDEMPNYDDSIPHHYTDMYDETEEEEEELAETETEEFEEEEKELEESKFDYSVKITADDVRQIRKRIHGGWTLKAISNEYGISARQVARIRDFESWADVK